MCKQNAFCLLIVERWIKMHTTHCVAALKSSFICRCNLWRMYNFLFKLSYITNKIALILSCKGNSHSFYQNYIKPNAIMQDIFIDFDFDLIVCYPSTISLNERRKFPFIFYADWTYFMEFMRFNFLFAWNKWWTYKEINNEPKRLV